MNRKDAILQSACDRFGRFGFRGTSLRDIARDAGVSLTLLSHHFGTKEQLLGAVIETQRAMLDERVDAMRRLNKAAAGRRAASDLVSTWIGIGFDTASTEDGEMFLRLQLRVLDEPSEEGLAAACGSLDDAGQLFTDALQRCYPAASEYAAASAFVFVNAALLKFLTATRRRFRYVQAKRPEDAATDDAAQLTAFLVAGIDAMLGGQAPSRAPAAERIAPTTAGAH